MEQIIKFSIANEYSKYPGPRKEFQGKNSAEKFYSDFLKPLYLRAISNNQDIVVDLDGTVGYSSAFLDGSFGELAREYGYEIVRKRLEFISEDEPFLIDEIDYYMKPKK